MTEDAQVTFDEKKALVLELWVKKAGVVMHICAGAGIARKTYYRWLENDPAFAEAVAEKKEELIDYGEGKLMKAMDEGNLTAIIFFLKCKGKKRGWVERRELVGGDDAPPVRFEEQTIKRVLASEEGRKALETLAGLFEGGEPEDTKEPAEEAPKPGDDKVEFVTQPETDEKDGTTAGTGE